MKNNYSKSRRLFLKQASLGLGALAFSSYDSILANTTSSQWEKGSSKYDFTMIGNGHIDPVWLWRWNEGISVVHSTFRSALDRMKENPNMAFTGSSAQFYQWIADNDPEMLKEIRQRINEGRWEIVGGWWIEPDMNIPCGESMVRQGLYGQLKFQELVGKRATVAFNPDSFGHTGTLPQIIKKQGMNNYVFMRPAAHEKNLPSDLFWWESPDGSKVLTYRIQNSYTDNTDVRGRIEAIEKIAPKQPTTSFMAFYGVGDHGGGPTKANLASIDGLMKEKGAPKIKYGTTEEYFKRMRNANNSSIPTVKDDLQHHSVGCYTVDSKIKKGNCASETAMINAEKICALGASQWNAAYPKKDFTSAWHRLLFMQFHDSMAGTSLMSHTKDAEAAYGYVQDIAQEAQSLAMQKLEWQIPTEDPESEYIVVFNPNAWDIKANIQYDLDKRNNDGESIVTDSNNTSLPHQWVLGESQCGGRRGIVFTCDLPAMGYKQIRVAKGTPKNISNPVKVTDKTLENDFYKITFNSNGTISLYDKKENKNVFGNNGGYKAIVIDDPSDTWSHDIVKFDNEIGSFDNAIIKPLENGPLRGTVRVTSTYGNSKLTTDWILYNDSPKIDANVILDWNEQHKMMKLSFPVDINSSVATYETPYGSIIRTTEGNEDPGQRWIDLTGKDGSQTYGFTVLNDAKYGYSVNDNDMRVSIVRSPVYAHHNPAQLDPKKEYVWMDQGLQSFRMALVPHKGSWQDANIPRLTAEFMNTPVCVYQGIHKGSLPKTASYLKVSEPNIIVTSIKEAEGNNDIILRCVETEGKATYSTLTFPSVNQSFTCQFAPNEIKTLKIDPQNLSIEEVNLLEE